MKQLPLSRVRIRNYKAIRDSGPLRLGPLTVFIGDNGSGKSSVIEALSTLQQIVWHDLDGAFSGYRAFEHIRHKGVTASNREAAERLRRQKVVSFKAEGRWTNRRYTAETAIRLFDDDRIGFDHESLRWQPGFRTEREKPNSVRVETESGWGSRKIHQEVSILDDDSLQDFWYRWQFLDLRPHAMMSPVPQKRSGRTVDLASDGSNIAEYLWSIREKDLRAFEGLLEALQAVVPYAKDLQPKFTSAIERAVYLDLAERDFEVPSWMLSTGTLRVLALLALLRHPTPPPVIFIEEIENGLDPRTMALIVEEIRRATWTGGPQIVATTHSPYLLDLLHIDHLIFVERIDGEPHFFRPADDEDVKRWAKEFSPGDLYTKGVLRPRPANTRKGDR